MFRRILVPVDGSTFAEHALPFALQLAEGGAAEIELALVHVNYTPVTGDVALRDSIRDWEEHHRQREAEYLSALGERVGAVAGRDVRTVLLDGDIVPALKREARERDVDLVVMTTHGRAGIERAWLGSVADALIRNLDVPVLLVRPAESAEPREPERALPRRHVMVALDGSERAERALPVAAAIARADGARITLVRVVAPPVAMTSPFIPHAAQITRDELREREDAARDYLQEKAESIRPLDLNVAIEVIIDYHPAHALLRFASSHGADLIGLGVHGRGPLGRLVLGSISDKVVRAADVPVLVC